MLGRTNLLSVPASESTELVFEQKFIVTTTSKDIIKLENINNVFFAYSMDESVLYGSDIENLKYLMKDGTNFKAKHTIFKDGFYYFASTERINGKAVVYKTEDFNSYTEITLKTGTSKNHYIVHGLFLRSNGEIVILVQESETDSNYVDLYLLMLETLEGYSETGANFLEISGVSKSIYSTSATATKMKKDRIYTSISSSSTTSASTNYVITLDGTAASQQAQSLYSYFACDYYFRFQTNKLYYSINGIEYVAINYPEMENLTCLAIFEYDGCIANVFSYTVDGEKITKLAYSSTPKGLADAVADAVHVDFEYTFNGNASVYKDDYVYIGSTGGLIIKAKITASDAIAPEVVVLKALSAKEALSKAKAYTENLFSTLENRIKALEESASNT